MRKLVVSEWVTLDGVFDADTMKQWFTPYDSDERKAHIKRMILAADAFLFGRITYEMLAGYWPHVKPDDPEIEIADRLNTAPKYVASSTLKKGDWQNSTILGASVAEEVAALKQQSGRDIMVFGSATLVESLVAADLVDEYRLLVHPIVMGSGKRYFRAGMAMTELKLMTTTPLSCGVMALSYQPAAS